MNFLKMKEVLAAAGHNDTKDQQMPTKCTLEHTFTNVSLSSWRAVLWSTQ